MTKCGGNLNPRQSVTRVTLDCNYSINATQQRKMQIRQMQWRKVQSCTEERFNKNRYNKESCNKEICVAQKMQRRKMQRTKSAIKKDTKEKDATKKDTGKKDETKKYKSCNPGPFVKLTSIQHPDHLKKLCDRRPTWFSQTSWTWSNYAW